MPKAGDRYGEWTLRDSISKAHVWHATKADGTPGVLKMPRSNRNATVKKRFYREVKGLQSLGGVSGVLPILDFDDAAEPGWFVMPPAELLADRLADADFEVTVEVFAQLAEILSHLSNRDEPVFHRDIKPGNLFWYADGPVFGDFGIARWARSVGVTQDWEKVGPMSYLAPEARWASQVEDWHRADVYSLTKTLWSLAAHRHQWDGKSGSDVRWPPLGQISGGDYSLRHFGGRDAVALSVVLRQATSDTPTKRPTAAVLAQELRSWLRQYPGRHPRPALPGNPKIIGHVSEIYAYLRELREATEEVMLLMTRRLNATLGDIDVDESVNVDTDPRGTCDTDGTPKSAAVMDDHGCNSGDEWDGAMVLRVQPTSGADIRLIVGAIMNSPTDMELIAERHRRGSDGGWISELAATCTDMVPGYPSSTEKLNELIEQCLTHPPAVSHTPARTWIADRVL
ncbi:protein kinase domain-containing protein [Nocardia cyriacigeorgica]|uniref:protein kinase domain-containing protein n=1 Tax=Nocardia cyriacigeorgica TaxID=135487 RepID=UPI002492806B|nr:protein kinase [Nocardia cyriacigeorgica]BDU04611.1 hypothetical protein FMUBM48_08740 [Nocardia cyriacigeorgica]